MTPQDKQEQIDAFIRKKLSAEQKIAFEQKIASNKELALEVNIQQDIYEALKSQKALDFRKQLDSFREFPKAEQEAKIRAIKPIAKSSSLRRILSIAASVLVIATAGVFTYMNMYSTSTKTLVAQHIGYPQSIRNAEKGSENIVGLEKQIKTAWLAADKAYRSEKYQVALDNLDEIEKLDPNFETHQQNDYFYHRAIVLLKLEKPKEALTAFNRAIELNTNFYDAKWQRALTLVLLEDKKEQARQALQDFIDEGGARAEHAQEILESL